MQWSEEDGKVEWEQFFPFISVLKKEEREQLAIHAKRARFQKNENLHGADGECTGLILIEQGIVRVYMMSEEGKEITLYRLYPGDICLLSASCVLESITFDVFVDAQTDCQVCIVPAGFVASLSKQHLEVENYLLKTATERFSDVMWAMQQILFLRFDQRLAIFLMDEAAQRATDTLYMTQEEIARSIGSAREVVSRMLKFFASEGLVRILRGGVEILDKARLRKLTQSA